MRVGRGANNDIVFVSGFISGNHALIQPDGIAHRITDLNSTNGLLYEGRRVSSVLLTDGAVVRIGDPTLGNFVSMTYHNPALGTPGKKLAAVSSFALSGSRVRIGRAGSGCEIELDSPQVSAWHASVTPSSGGFAVSDEGSTNGTFVNGAAVSSRALAAGDAIGVGPFRLVLNGSRLEWQTDPNGLRVDALNLSRAARGKTFLNNVSLTIMPREFVALVGGSGAGKSTLMKALSGFARADSGQVRVNGEDFYTIYEAFKSTLGYVPQDDIIHRTLEVGRALGFAARLRLPPDLSSAEMDQRVADVLEQVQMEPHRSKLVETLSGGQRKRVSIGVELLASPNLLFLDEPTSGLDPGLEKHMMYSLRTLADGGRTVVLVTHATANIHQCDLVAFMALGRLVYYGPPSEALAFFGVTSGDFADIYSRLEEVSGDTKRLTQEAHARGLQAELAGWCAQNPSPSSVPSIAELWEWRYRSSAPFQRFVADRQRVVSGPPSANANAGRSGAKALPARQFGILTRRYLELFLQDRRNLLILLAQVPVVVALLLIMVNPDALSLTREEPGRRYDAQTVLFMLATVSVWFGIINAAREITKESAVFKRERMFNLRIAPYVLSKFAVLSAVTLVQTLLLVALLALRVCYPTDTGLFTAPALEVFVTALLSALAGVALGLVVSAFAATPDRAISVVPMLLIPQIIFAGLIFEIKGAAMVLSWLSVSHWTMGAFGASLNLNRFCDTLPACPNESLYAHSSEHLAVHWGVLVAFTVVGLLLTAILLRRKDGVVE